MQIVLISDTHGYHQRIEIPKGDILIRADDLTGMHLLMPVYAHWRINQLICLLL